MIILIYNVQNVIINASVVRVLLITVLNVKFPEKINQFVLVLTDSMMIQLNVQIVIINVKHAKVNLVV